MFFNAANDDVSVPKTFATIPFSLKSKSKQKIMPPLPDEHDGDLYSSGCDGSLLQWYFAVYLTDVDLQSNRCLRHKVYKFYFMQTIDYSQY